METSAPSMTAEAAPRPPNPHIFSRQLIGLILWVGLLSSLLGVFAFILGMTLATLTFLDAWKSGIYKRRDTQGPLNISPMSWGIAMALIFIVAFPVYLLHRTELRTIQATNGFYYALVAVGAILIISTAGSLILWM